MSNEIIVVLLLYSNIISYNIISRLIIRLVGCSFVCFLSNVIINASFSSYLWLLSSIPLKGEKEREEIQFNVYPGYPVLL